MVRCQIAGIPALAEVHTCRITEGSYSPQAETPEDYYGARDLEWTLCDRNGRPALWLERKMTPQEFADIEELILRQHEDALSTDY